MRYIVFVWIIVLMLFFPVLTTYFSHDDFFSIKVSLTDGSLGQFVNLFGFHSFQERGIAFYRPLFREVFFNLYYSLFGLDSHAARIFQLVIHLTNIWLVYKFLRTFLQNKGYALWSSLFFGITAANSAILYYLTGGIQASGATMFILLCLIFFWKYLQNNQAKFIYGSFAFFILALSSHELSVILPLLLSGLIFVSERKTYKAFLKSARELWLFVLVLLIYLYLDYFKIGFSKSEEQYHAVFSLKQTVNSYAWYYSWALGLPEMLIDFVNPGLKLNPSLFKYWGDYFSIIIPSFIFSSIILFFSLIVVTIQRRILQLNKKVLFLAFWTIIGITPIVFLPSHKSTYYLATTLPAFWGLVGYLIFSLFNNLKITSKTIAYIFISIATLGPVFLSITSIQLANTTYIAAVRGHSAQKLISDIKSEYPTLPKGATIFIKNDPDYPFVSKDWGGSSKQAKFILNDQDGLQLVYKDPLLKILYQDFNPGETDVQKSFSFIAKIN